MSSAGVGRRRELFEIAKGKNTMSAVKLLCGGQITLPAEIRKALELGVSPTELAELLLDDAMLELYAHLIIGKALDTAWPAHSGSPPRPYRTLWLIASRYADHFSVNHPLPSSEIAARKRHAQQAPNKY